MRVPVELRRSFRLINHGPTTLVGVSSEGRTNAMAVAWVMPLDFDPPKVVCVFGACLTRDMIDVERSFTISIPTSAQVDLVYTLGSTTGHDGDKVERHHLEYAPATLVKGPLISGCVGWLECRVISDRQLEKDQDLYIAEVVAAWADDSVFKDGNYRFSSDEQRTIHHVARGSFFLTGETIQAKM